MKEHQQTHKHKRFYIFSHINGESIKYRTSTGDWSAEFFRAMLWHGLDFATKKAIELEKQYARWASSTGMPVERFVVGCVNIEVDTFFTGHAVPSTVKR
jgi:hypothetical protein